MTPFAAPGLGIAASAVMPGFGLWRLSRAEARARERGEGCGGKLSGAEGQTAAEAAAQDLTVRKRAAVCSSFDPAEIAHGEISSAVPPVARAFLPLAAAVAVNLLMPFYILPGLDASFLTEEALGATSLSAVGGAWAVITAFAAALLVLAAFNRRRLPALRDRVDAGVNASALPVLSVASLVGLGSVAAALPAFAAVRDWVVPIEGGLLVSLAVATNVLASLTGSASGGLTIALDAPGNIYMRIAAEQGIDPGLLPHVAVIGAGTLDSLPHNGAAVTLLAVCGAAHRESYFDIVMVSIVGGLLGLAAVIGPGSAFGSF